MATFIHGELFDDLSDIMDIVEDLKTAKKECSAQSATAIDNAIDLINEVMDNAEQF